MKNLSKLFVAIGCYLLASSCGNPSDQKLSMEPEKDPNSYRENLPGYDWLNTSANFNNDAYKDSIYYYFNQGLQEKNYENAAVYLLSYSYVLENNMEFDSIFFNASRNLYNSHKADLSGESQSNLCYYLGTQSHLKHDLVQSSEWLKKAIEIDPVSKAHKQIVGFSNFAIRRL